ncbi:Pyruvate kinase [Staphylococcus aureus]|uniref:Pyruvate kinase n=1 Tax=Staphylococcus aureus TaxID=1280 RepID=A0A380EIU9_STAAU|nr:Pyruvate kinase [Staphylococcus aureus]
MVWGVQPVVKKGRKSTDALLNNAVATAVETGRVSNGDLIIITAGVPTGETGTTNMMKIHLVGDEIANGQGIGRGSVVGTTLVAETVKDLEGKDLSDKVIVTNSIDETFCTLCRKSFRLNYRRKWYYITKCNCWFRKRYSNSCRCRKSC